MALKEFGASNPRTRDKNWKEDIPMASIPKLDTWYAFRLVGGVFTYAQHWVEFVNKSNEKKMYPVDCANWDRDREDASRKGGCPACEAKIKPSVKYLLNVLDRSAQEKGDDDPIRALEIPPTVMRAIMDLSNLNKVKGEPRHVNHSKFGIDVHVQKKRSAKRGGVEWQVQRGERTPLTDEEKELELIDFEEYWLDPDTHKCREDLKRHGYFDDEESSKKSSHSSDADDEVYFSKKSKGRSTVDDDDDDDEEETPPPSRKKKKRRAPPPPVDDDDDDDDDEEETPPPTRKKKKRRAPPPPVDDDDDDDDDFDDDDFDV